MYKGWEGGSQEAAQHVRTLRPLNRTLQTYEAGLIELLGAKTKQPQAPPGKLVLPSRSPQTERLERL